MAVCNDYLPTEKPFCPTDLLVLIFENVVPSRDGTIPASSIPIPIPIPLTVVRFQFRFRFNSDSDSIKLEKGSIPIPIPIPESELSNLWSWVKKPCFELFEQGLSSTFWMSLRNAFSERLSFYHMKWKPLRPSLPLVKLTNDGHLLCCVQYELY